MLQATDPEGGRVSYYVTSPFDDRDFGKGYSVTQDGVICFADNQDGLFKPTTLPYENPSVAEESIYIGAVDPAGGMSVIHYKVYIQVRVLPMI